MKFSRLWSNTIFYKFILKIFNERETHTSVTHFSHFSTQTKRERKFKNEMSHESVLSNHFIDLALYFVYTYKYLITNKISPTGLNEEVIRTDLPMDLKSKLDSIVPKCASSSSLSPKRFARKPCERRVFSPTAGSVTVAIGAAVAAAAPHLSVNRILRGGKRGSKLDAFFVKRL